MNIEIHLYEGTIITAFYENYNSSELATLINDTSNNIMIAFGDTILAKHNIKMVKPVEEIVAP